MMTVNTQDSLLAGSIAGSASVLICHPLDVVRTTVQLNPQLSLRNCASQIYTSYGLPGFYKGIVAPFLAQSTYKAVIFTSNAITKQYLFPNRHSAATIFWSGCIAGSINALFVAPVELIRTAEIMVANSQNGAKSITSTLYHIINSSGFTNLWRGSIPTVLRDGPGVGFYMLAFEVAKKEISKITDHKKGIPLWARIFAGSCAGLFFWIWALPVDTIKTVIESKIMKDINDHPSLRQTVRPSFRQPKVLLSLLHDSVHELMNHGGVFAFYRAWPAALGRGIPAAAVTLTTYDMCLEYFSGLRRKNMK